MTALAPTGALGPAARRYRVTHRTEYRYGAPVVVSHTVARLLPRPDLPHQHTVSGTVTVDPEPTRTHTHRDGFGNTVTAITLDEPHDHLAVTATSEVALHARPDPGPLWWAPWEHTVAATAGDTSEEGLRARLCRLDSPRVERGPDLRALGALAFTPGRPLAEAATALNDLVHGEFEFLPGSTDVTTPVPEVLAERRGVCQDFAHVVLGALRSLGLGAQYVSGYLETKPPPGQPHLVGSDASHAWVGLYVPGGGWVDLDPTNALVQPAHHVTVGWGRDYTDVAPVRGVVYGPRSGQELAVAVDVTRL
jgi:transglutaminase-like putative cysteine protease